MQPLAELTLQEGQEHGRRYDGRKISWESGSVHQAEPACSPSGLHTWGLELSLLKPSYTTQERRPGQQSPGPLGSL